VDHFKFWFGVNKFVLSKNKFVSAKSRYVLRAPYKSVPLRLNVYKEELSLIGTKFESPEVAVGGRTNLTHFWDVAHNNVTYS
jgi:hypothetical protein